MTTPPPAWAFDPQLYGGMPRGPDSGGFDRFAEGACRGLARGVASGAVRGGGCGCGGCLTVLVALALLGWFHQLTGGGPGFWLLAVLAWLAWRTLPR